MFITARLKLLKFLQKLKIRWEDGSTNTYRNGAEGSFDLRVLPEVSCERERTEL